MGNVWHLLLLSTVLNWGTAAVAAPLQLLTEDAPPMSFLRAGQVDGMSAEVVRELANRLGEEIRIELVPWTRAYQLAQQQADTAVFSTVRTPEREALFRWVGPLVRGQTRFYSLKSSQLQVRDLQEAARIGPIAVPREWYTYQTLKAHGLDNVYGTSSSRQMISLLKHGRASLIATEDITLAQELAAGGLALDQVQAHYSFMSSDYYIAFSPQTDAARVQRWQTELESMQADGSLRRIVQRWLPGVMQPGGPLR